MDDIRQRVHKIVDLLPRRQLTALAGLLDAMLPPAPEVISEDEERAIEEARQWLAENGGRGIPNEEVLADFGLTLDDFRRMGEERAASAAAYSDGQTSRVDSVGAN